MTAHTAAATGLSPPVSSGVLGPVTRLVEQGSDDRGDAGAGDRATGDRRRRREPDPIEETCTNLRTPARPAASASSTAAPRPTESLRGAPLPSAGREYHRVSPGQQHRDSLGSGCLQIADHRLSAGLLHIGGVGGGS